MIKYLLFLLFFNFIIYSQWEPDIRLTNNPANSFTSYNNAWCIATSGNFVHIVWYDERDGNREIYYKRSTDEGLSWGIDTRLTNNAANSNIPCISVSGSNIHIVWYDNRDGNDEIYYKSSTDGGLIWGADTRLTNNTANSWNPSVSVSAQVLHVMWTDNRDGNYEIYHKRSMDGGLNWGIDTRLTNNSANSNPPCISISGSNVHFVWYDNRDGNNEIYYKLSTDAGTSWGADTRLTNNTANSFSPSVSVSGQLVNVVWFDNRDGNDEIYYKRSTDAGISWGADTRLTNNSSESRWPSVSISGQVVHVVWHDTRDLNAEIYYKRSTDVGISWEADTRLTNYVNGISSFPSVSVSGQIVQVVWEDNRDGNFEVYYKRNSTINLLPPSTPSSLTALAVSSSRINLNWTDNSSNETGFKIERSTNAGANWILKDSTVQNIITYTDTALTANTIYHYRIYAYNLAGNSPYSNVAFDTTFISPPAVPVLISPPNNSGGIIPTTKLDWSPIPTATSYRVQVSSDSTFPTSQFDSVTVVDSIFVPAGRLNNNTRYFWHVRAQNVGGNSAYAAYFIFTTSLVGIINNNEIPKEFKLYNNYPNPFNPTTNIRFALPKSSFSTLAIYDVLGREIVKLVNEQLNSGTYEAEWDATNYPSGIYFYKLEAGDFLETKKMIIMK